MISGAPHPAPPQPHLLQLCQACGLCRCLSLLLAQPLPQLRQLLPLSLQAALGQVGSLQVGLQAAPRRSGTGRG